MTTNVVGSRLLRALLERGNYNTPPKVITSIWDKLKLHFKKVWRNLLTQ